MRVGDRLVGQRLQQWHNVRKPSDKWATFTRKRQ